MRFLKNNQDHEDSFTSSLTIENVLHLFNLEIALLLIIWFIIFLLAKYIIPCPKQLIDEEDEVKKLREENYYAAHYVSLLHATSVIVLSKYSDYSN